MKYPVKWLMCNLEEVLYFCFTVCVAKHSESLWVSVDPGVCGSAQGGRGIQSAAAIKPSLPTPKYSFSDLG